MIFSEIYGSYFKAVSAILARAVEGSLTERELTRTVLERFRREPRHDPRQAQRRELAAAHRRLRNAAVPRRAHPANDAGETVAQGAAARSAHPSFWTL